MERSRRIYLEALTLFNDVSIEVRVKIGYSMAFQSKMASFEIMYKEALKKAKNLETVVIEEMSENKIALTKTTRALYDATAFFEAYLNSFYSLLQIIAKFTPLFYEKNRDQIPDENFGMQVNYFVAENPKLDPEFSSFLKEARARWYETLRDNRNATTHRLSAFLAFEKDYTVLFRDYPSDREFDWLNKKTYRKLEEYLDRSFNDLFDFLEFYTQHFRKRVPKSVRTKLILKNISG